MRVLFLASYFPRPSKPQIGTWALEQAKALSRAAEVQVACCTSYVPTILGAHPRVRPWTEVPKSFRWDNVDIKYLKSLYYPVNPFKKQASRSPFLQMEVAWLSAKNRLLQAIKEFSPDLIYAHHTSVNGYFAHRLSRITNLPYVITDHDFAEIASCEHLPARKAFYEPIIRGASRNICVCNRMEADMKRIFPFARTSVVHNGINTHPSEIYTTPRPAELQKKKVIFSAGMFTPRKGFPLLIEAFSKLAERHPDAVLRIGGDGTQRPEIEAVIDRLQLRDRVQLLGLLSQKQVFQEMQWSDIFALASWDEPFGVVFTEAMSAGKPIVAASDGGINDVVDHRVHGMIFPPKDLHGTTDALDYLLANPVARLEMGRNAKDLVDTRLTWDANTRVMLKIFEKAAKTPAPVWSIPEVAHGSRTPVALPA